MNKEQPAYISTSDYTNESMMEYSIANCVRSIPHLCDGLKPSQRKIIFSCAKYENEKPINLNRLASRVAFDTDYHHGETSIVDSIVLLARDYRGTNNINLLEPHGQFGNILSDKSGAGRYIHSRISKNFRNLFPKDYDDILLYNTSDDTTIEPKYYIPLLPLILINGVSGVGTAYASNIFKHNPNDIKEYIKAKLNGVSYDKEITPYYKDYKGGILKGDDNDNQWIFTGKIQRISSTKIKITELPIGINLEKTLDRLKLLIAEGVIKDYDNDSTINDGYNITVTGSREFIASSDEELLQTFKLIKKSTMNITCWIPLINKDNITNKYNFNLSGKIKKYENIKELIDDFIEIKLLYCDKYKNNKLHQLKLEHNFLSEKSRFIQFAIDNLPTFTKKTKNENIELLKNNNFSDENIEKFINIKIFDITQENIDKLEKSIIKVDKEIKELSKLTNVMIYLEELKKYEQAN